MLLCLLNSCLLGTIDDVGNQHVHRNGNNLEYKGLVDVKTVDRLQ